MLLLKVVKLLWFCCVHLTNKTCNNFSEIDDHLSYHCQVFGHCLLYTDYVFSLRGTEKCHSDGGIDINERFLYYPLVPMTMLTQFYVVEMKLLS